MQICAIHGAKFHLFVFANIRWVSQTSPQRFWLRIGARHAPWCL
jgi:hypothetical protein